MVFFFSADFSFYTFIFSKLAKTVLYCIDILYYSWLVILSFFYKIYTKVLNKLFTPILEDLTFISHRKILGGVKGAYKNAVLAKYNSLIPRNSVSIDQRRAAKIYRDAFFLKNLYYVSSLIMTSERQINCGGESFLPFTSSAGLVLGSTSVNQRKLLLYRDLEQFSNFLSTDTSAKPISVLTREEHYSPSLDTLSRFNSFKNFFSLSVNHSLFASLAANLEIIFTSNLNSNTIIAKERRWL